MYTVKTSDEFIADIRGIDERLKRIRLSGIEVERKTQSIRYHFICDSVVDDILQSKILDEVEKITSPAFKSVSITVKKIVSNDELINNEIFNYLKKGYPSVAIFLKQSDVRSTVFGDNVKYVIRFSKDNADYIKKNGVLITLNEYLATKFCSEFIGDIEIKENEEHIDLTSQDVFESELEKIQRRTIKVLDPVVIDDLTMGNIAFYIEDSTEGSVTVCGKITEITERETKSGKPFFIIHLDDTTGKTSGVYFTKKNTYEKIRLLQVGDAIIVRGNMGEYNGKPSFTIDKINRCTFPEDFVKEGKFKSGAPKEYKNIFPEKAETVRNATFFDSGSLPEELTNSTYVVFDIETTGLDLMNNGITEIGAVKIEKGRIVEQWTTLIKPDYPIPPNITELTGIDEEMVKNCPKIGAVLPDFMKFINGAILVAHNAEFDVKFIKRFAAMEEFDVNNKVLDTLELSRKYMPSLRKNDLHTLADYFGIIFRHHRALSDAYATAEVFIELMKMKNSK
ncbi:MAG: ribonuclease H-like domain-containing protein [Clostridia bacterium]|nr:ribonuclease H-like domain-containing protein [Clostridia bacterium]